MNMLKLKGKSNKTMRKWLSNWSYSDLEFKLVYKCKMNGIRVEFVDARYTSQKCSVCKTIDKASRNGNRYTCRHCGNPRQLHHPGHAIRAGCSQSAVWMGCHR